MRGVHVGIQGLKFLATVVRPCGAGIMGKCTMQNSQCKKVGGGRCPPYGIVLRHGAEGVGVETYQEPCGGDEEEKKCR